MTPGLDQVLESAARLQRLVPDTVLVGDSAAALYAGHRDSFDHDHVLADLAQRFDLVLEAVESTDGWVTNRVTPGKVILGELGGIETGIRALIPRTPLQTQRVRLGSGAELTVPTADETLRIKGFLIVRRNRTRDYLDVAALAGKDGPDHAATVLAAIDDYYADQHGSADGVASQLQVQLADPQPADRATTRQLSRYKNLAPQWHDWNAVTAVCHRLAELMLAG